MKPHSYSPILQISYLFLIVYFLAIPSKGYSQKVAAGNAHVVYLCTDGKIWAWGNNGNGQLGDSTTITRSTPKEVPNFSSVLDIAAGNGHVLAIKEDSSLWSWGTNFTGQLGLGNTTSVSVPLQVSGLQGVVSITAGQGHSMALLSNGSIWAWGANWNGELGINSTSQKRSPVQIPGIAPMYKIAAGQFHSMALGLDSTVWTWGDNVYGQLGDSSNRNKLVPVQLQGLTGITEIAGGWFHSLALDKDRTVWAWGDNNYGQLGDGSNVNKQYPVQVQGLDSVIAIKAGRYHSLALRSDGSLWVWGNNQYGQLGDSTSRNKNLPVPVKSNFHFSSMTAGTDFSVALDSANTVSSWGRNSFGQLGNRTSSYSQAPDTSLISQALFSFTDSLRKVSFVDSSRNTISWFWDFGDGNSSIQQNPVHEFDSAGIYEVCLQVENACGSHTLCKSVQITCPKPQAFFTFADTLLNLSFKDSSIQAESWLWDFGDGNTSSLQNPTHSYDSTGTYTVCLISSAYCGSDTICNMVNVVGNSASIFRNDLSNDYVEIFPNPITHSARIRISELLPLKDPTFVIYNLHGKIMRTLSDISQRELVFRRAELPAGVYFFMVLDQGKPLSIAKMILE